MFKKREHHYVVSIVTK